MDRQSFNGTSERRREVPISDLPQHRLPAISGIPTLTISAECEHLFDSGSSLTLPRHPRVTEDELSISRCARVVAKLGKDEGDLPLFVFVESAGIFTLTCLLEQSL